MSLSDNARTLRTVAAELRAEAQNERASSFSAMNLCALAAAFERSADRLKAADVAEALETAEAHRCTIDHATLKVRLCPACGAPK